MNESAKTRTVCVVTSEAIVGHQTYGHMSVDKVFCSRARAEQYVSEAPKTEPRISRKADIRLEYTIYEMEVEE